ncbi:E3 ubiquitin-protein ligase ubr11-like protein [Elsinoe fawcettii]|nr:E3 ubiquitin-protein ligase ubr11-like protein [Elsinoe fawcettii]
MSSTALEATLSRALRDLPHKYKFRYTPEAKTELLKTLCVSLVGSEQKLPLLFPSSPPSDSGIQWSLRKAQNAVEGAEYTEAARGHACGHIFKSGESSYHCKTCTTDDTCVLCARCFAESDHEGHAVFVSISPGNSGCCDCGDDEAWVRPVICGIHTADAANARASTGKAAQPAALSDDILAAVSLTIGKTLDYLCDVFSCSPEQLRLPKTEQSVKQDERSSRLSSERYDGPEPVQEVTEYSLVLWNDEKHTIDQVMNQVARACRRAKTYGEEKAIEVDDIGRSIIEYSEDVTKLLDMARILEQIKVSVTVRASRDTFRELMCETIIEWLSDIFGCSVGSDHHILRQTICSELFRSWTVGSSRINEQAGKAGIYDHEAEERNYRDYTSRFIQITGLGENITFLGPGDDDDDDSEDDDVEVQFEDVDVDDNTTERAEETETDLNPILRRAQSVRRAVIRRNPELVNPDIMDIADDEGNIVVLPDDTQMDIDIDEEDDNANEVSEATMAGYPPQPPPPTAGQTLDPSRQTSLTDSHEMATPHELEETETVIGSAKLPTLPKTPSNRNKIRNRPPKFWLTRPGGWTESTQPGSPENLNERLRIDFLVLYDLRLWKTLRDTLRHLFISTVITMPEYKRLLAIRFAGLYTLLAQLYLIADREPDHSIINLSLQILTTPSLTAEVVERANFLTHLMAILYTFLTTRQVGYPKDITPLATLAFDAGAIANRRMFHFFIDAKYVFQSPAIQDRLRSEPQYLQQFLDLVKLHQGICPNVRAVGEHVEYETDAWLSASMIMKDINRLSRLVVDAFFTLDSSDSAGHFLVALKELFIVTTVSSLGLESKRFQNAELKGPLQFGELDLLPNACVVPDIKVITAHMSFHHPLHYITSWMLQAGKDMSRDQMQSCLSSAMQHISNLQVKYPEATTSDGPFSSLVKPNDWVSALFDPPLRVCVWLSQMRAGMWVRNGMTLRHQMHSYRSPTQRDVTYQRDIFMLQAGMVLCDFGSIEIGDKFLRQMISRYELTNWMSGKMTLAEQYEESQQMDVIEDFFQLLIIILTEREDLLPDGMHGKPTKRAVQRDIAHTLCFKPMSYSDLAAKLTDRITDAESFDEILEEMTTYKPPEGLNDHGTFELRTEYAEKVDPYYGFYSRNQREEADHIYRELHAKKLGIDKADVVPEPQLPPISSGLFADLGAFTRTRTFAILISEALAFATYGHDKTTTVEKSRIEPILQLILHLSLLSIHEDATAGIVDNTPASGFVDNMVTLIRPSSDERPRPAQTDTIFNLLNSILSIEDYSACHPRVRVVIERAQQKRRGLFTEHNLLDPGSRTTTSTPVSNLSADKEAKKKAALERQARVMAQFKAQQNSFMTNQGMDWDVDDLSDDGNDGMEDIKVDETKTETTRDWPADACILCQEDATDSRLYGCFAFISESGVQRQTPLDDPEYVQEVLDTPTSLDRSAESIRPFGKASKNKRSAEKIGTDGNVTHHEIHALGEGFTKYENILRDNVVTSCGHMMHFSCFDTYLNATQRRQSQQISRNHPENLDTKEFLCPLCKALGNAFLPVIWKPRKESYPGLLGQASQPFEAWLANDIGSLESILETSHSYEKGSIWVSERTSLAQAYIRANFKSNLASQLLVDDNPQSPSMDVGGRRRSNPLASIFDLRRLSSSVGLTSTPLLNFTTGSELTKAYNVLCGSIETNCHVDSNRNLLQEGSPYLFTTVLQSVASSIAAVEIHCRGVASQHSLLTGIPDQTLTNLRVYCETVSSLMAMEQLKDPRKVSKLLNNQDMFSIGQLLGLTDRDERFPDPTPMRYNVFWAITLCSFLPQSDWQKHGHNLIQLGLIAEVIKAISMHCSHKTMHRELVQAKAAINPAASVLPHIKTLLDRGLVITNSSESDIAKDSNMQKLQLAVERHALIYLRKVLILTHVRSGVDYSVASTTLDSEAPELDRLCTLLRIPSLGQIFSIFSTSSPAANSLNKIVGRWITTDRYKPGPSSPLHIDHPAIFELVGLPKTFDSLSEEAIKRRCPTTGKAVTDPVVCLLCGEIFCSQANCCRDRQTNFGGASRHRKKCGGNIGLYINIRKCMVVFLHERNGSWAQAPYLDKYGEPDPTMRRHHQLFLNQKRYDRLLRDVWLGHGIPSVISRKLEGDINNGGWETL